MTSKARTLLGKGRRRIRRTFSTDEERGVTAEHWGEDARERAESEDWQGLYWQSYVLTQRHINRDISGGTDENWVNFTKRRFFPQRVDLALSLGCGDGALERHALQVGIAERFEAFDLAPEAIEVARGEAESAGFGDRVSYGISDLNTIELEPERYDAVFVAQALHHIEALERVLDEIRSSLTEGGLFVVNEYVGPKRFQYPHEYLPLMDGLLEALPESHRRNLRDGTVKRKVVRLEADDVYRIDPSESVRSDEIMELIEERFEIVYRADFGGTLLQFVLSDIAGNFDPADPKDVAMIDLVCLYEKTLIERGVLPSDFVYLVAQRRAG